MREACIRAVEAAIGRALSASETKRIEDRIRASMRLLARQDAQRWRTLSEPERLREAGVHAAQGLLEEAEKAKVRVGLTILANQKISGYLADQVADGRDKNAVEALQRTLVARYDLKNGPMQSVESRADATFENAARQIADVFETVNPGLWRRIQRGIWTTEPLRRAFVDALHGKTRGVPPEIVKAAKAYHEIADALRQQFNAAGGVVGRLENWGLPHTWSARLAGKIGPETFVSDMMQWADRRAYVHEDGRAYSDAELKAFFEEAWATIASDGMSKPREARPYPGGAMKANRGRHHRVIHLRPEAAYDALRKYSEQNPLEAMLGGLRRMSRDVALVETFGPNADLQFEHQLTQALTAAAKADPTQAQALNHKAFYLRNLFSHLAGNDPPPVNRAFADFNGLMRSFQVASKLGGATITSISDFGTLYQTALLNKLNPFQVMLNSSLAWAPKSRRFARRMGLMLDTLTSEAQRYAHDNLTSKDIGAGVASAVIRASGLGFVTNARRLGFSMTMMDAIGHLTRQKAYADVTKLDAGDHAILASKGIDQETWDIWRAAKLDRWGANHTLLTPDAIMAAEGYTHAQKRDAVIKLLGVVKEEQDLAIITPGARERVQMRMGTNPGTLGGEIMRTGVLFKSFPWTVLVRHLERGLAADNPLGRVGYLASLYVLMSLGGAAALSIANVLAGRDPPDLDLFADDDERRSRAIRNWGHALLKGGGLGIFGDFLFAETTQYGGSTLAETMAGPNISTLGEAESLAIGNAVQALQGEETNFGQEAVRFARGITPGANLWYTRAITDRAIFNELMEWAEPGSLEKMRRRQERTRGQTYWWNPEDNPLAGELPERGPEFAN